MAASTARAKKISIVLKRQLPSTSSFQENNEEANDEEMDKATPKRSRKSQQSMKAEPSTSSSSTAASSKPSNWYKCTKLFPTTQTCPFVRSNSGADASSSPTSSTSGSTSPRGKGDWKEDDPDHYLKQKDREADQASGRDDSLPAAFRLGNKDGAESSEESGAEKSEHEEEVIRRSRQIRNRERWELLKYKMLISSCSADSSKNGAEDAKKLEKEEEWNDEREREFVFSLL